MYVLLLIFGLFGKNVWVNNKKAAVVLVSTEEKVHVTYTTHGQSSVFTQ